MSSPSTDARGSRELATDARGSREPTTEGLDPRVVIVTGGAGGIGWATAQRFAARGDRVVIFDRDGEAAAARVAELGEAHLALTVDVVDEAAVVASVATVVARHGRIDVLVNNAGVIDDATLSAIDTPLAAFERLMAINLDGAYVAAREVGRTMLAQGHGAIVNVASLAGVVAIPGRNGYSISKAAVIGWTRALACEWAGSGVRVNAVLPGYVATDIVRSLVKGGRVNLSRVERRIPLGRLAEPDEIAAVIEHLASAQASFTSGAMVAVDGGYQAFGGTGDAAAGGTTRTPAAGSRVVLVTGAASGIGAAIAARFAADGDTLVLFDRDARRVGAVAERLGAQHLAITGDIAVEANGLAAVTAAHARFGRIDVLVNNAGVADTFVPTIDQSLADFRRVMGIDLTGALTMAKAVAPGMIARGTGTVVNIASIAGLLGLPRRNAYCAAKAGIVMMTRSLACEWAAHGVRVNAVAPGYVATPGVMALEKAGRRTLDAVRSRTPMGRLGEPHEIAAAVAFLASSDASYMTGTCLSVDGGWSAFGDVAPAADGQNL